ncbi:hypothetical protein [Paludisphaera rhizosphaerae]|uniref:hypothetical protein n=1 Tax=Paludisphaera rhizosphaerae TaxID=2711216 RepID=UPI0013EDE765|nr:hypothetical protein [Paludisphaera rhizosphaerae]
MIRQFVPRMFWVGILALGLLLVLTAARSAKGVSHAPPHLHGVWDGFYVADDGARGSVESAIREQNPRRFAGNGLLIDLPTGNLAYEFLGTVTDDFIQGTGRFRGGSLAFHGGLTTFAGQGGDAGVMSLNNQFQSRGWQSQVNTLLLHPFPGMASPSITGDAVGTFRNVTDPDTGNPTDPSFVGIARVTISSRSSRGTFAGHMELSHGPNDPPFLSWPFLSTTSLDRQTIWVSQGATGNGVYHGEVLTGPHSTKSTAIWGIFQLNFLDGRTVFSTYNISFAR